MRTTSSRDSLRSVAAFVIAALASGCAANNVAAPTFPTGVPQNVESGSTSFSGYVLPHNIRRVCSDADPSVPHCEALVKADGGSTYGYVPSDLQAAYNLPSSTAGKGQMVAVVELGDDPAVESDLFMYRNTFKLPVCSTLNGCFIRVNQRGYAGHYPPPDANNAVETALDLDMVSAVCPNCRILLVEAGNSWGDMAKAVDTAVNLGAAIVSVSYGGSDQHVNPQHYDHPGVIITAASGDHGYLGRRQQVPAELPTVVSVGGTSLTRDSSSPRGWTETVWGGTGSGCSTFAKPAWQADPKCKGRTANDIAAVADPNTGVAVYDTYKQVGWMELGGTSVSTPINAAVFALAGNASTLNAAQSFYQSSNQAYLYDVTTGFNGGCSRKYSYLCTGEVGYDAPTGWGTPNGIGAY